MSIVTLQTVQMLFLLNVLIRRLFNCCSMDREVKCDVTVNGVILPENAIVTIPIYVLHHDPEVWPEPDKFDPER